MENAELEQAILRLEAQQAELIELVSQSQTKKHKRDFWEKLNAIGPILSGFLIAMSALICTYQYNQQQIKLQEAQTIEKFIPHLMGTDTSKRMAILALKTLVNTDLAAKYAAMFPSAGTVSALRTIANTGNSQDRRIVSQALGKTIDELKSRKKDDSDVKADAQDARDVIEQNLAESAATAVVSPPPPKTVDSQQVSTTEAEVVAPASADKAQPVTDKSHVVPDKAHVVMDKAHAMPATGDATATHAPSNRAKDTAAKDATAVVEEKSVVESERPKI